MAADLARALGELQSMDAPARASRHLDLARAARHPDQPYGQERPTAPHWQWLWQAFGKDNRAAVTAPYLAENPGADQWWQCEPIHIEIGREQLRIGRSTDARLTADETATLAAEADAILREHGTLHANSDLPWLLRFDQPWSLEAIAMDAARGQSVSACLPVGTDALRWARVLNEIQVRWHQSPVNQARAEQGRPVINGLWLHGGGTRDILTQRPFATVACADPVLRGWGRASGLSEVALTTEDALTTGTGDTVTLWPDLLEAAIFEDWHEWLRRFAALDSRLQQLRERAFTAGFNQIEVLLSGQRILRRLTIGRRDGLRFWRARNALAELLAEPST